MKEIETKTTRQNEFLQLAGSIFGPVDWSRDYDGTGTGSQPSVLLFSASSLRPLRLGGEKFFRARNQNMDRICETCVWDDMNFTVYDPKHYDAVVALARAYEEKTKREVVVIKEF